MKQVVVGNLIVQNHLKISKQSEMPLGSFFHQLNAF